MARMAPEPPSQVCEVAGFLVGVRGGGRGGSFPPGAGGSGGVVPPASSSEPVAHGGGEVLAVLWRAGAERPGNPYLAEYLGRDREIRHREPLDLPPFGEHQRTRT